MKCLGKMYGQGDGRCGAGSRDGGEIVGAAVSSAYLVCGAVGSELDATGRPSGEGGGGGAGRESAIGVHGEAGQTVVAGVHDEDAHGGGGVENLRPGSAFRDHGDTRWSAARAGRGR